MSNIILFDTVADEVESISIDELSIVDMQSFLNKTIIKHGLKEIRRDITFNFDNPATNSSHNIPLTLFNNDSQGINYIKVGKVKIDIEMIYTILKKFEIFIETTVKRTCQAYIQAAKDSEKQLSLFSEISKSNISDICINDYIYSNIEESFIEFTFQIKPLIIDDKWQFYLKFGTNIFITKFELFMIYKRFDLLFR